MGSIRRAAMGTGLLLATVLASAGEPAAATPVKLDIKSQPMADALNQWAQATGLQVIFPEESATAKLVAPEVRGRYVPAVALTKLLENSGLRYEYLNERTVVVKVAQTGQVKPSSDQDKENGPPSGVAPAQGESPRTEKHTGTYSSSPQTAEGGVERKPQIEEIVVTAQKKGEQRLLEVPMPVSVVDTEKLATQSQVLLREYANTIPGLSVTPGQATNTALSIRGVTTGGDGNPTVGVLLDDLPYDGSLGGTGAGQVPDIDPGDLARIEVLRGPQGTLYGANSMGGLIKYVSKDPSTEVFSARVEAGYNSVHNGSVPGFNLRGAANVPLSDDLAVRISGFERQDPGYIDNPTFGKRGVNEAHADGGRLMALWRPSEDLSIKLNAYYQSTRADANQEAYLAPGLGDLQQNYVTNAGRYTRDIQAYSATIDYKVGGFDLTSLTGYNSTFYRDGFDLTSKLGPITSSIFGVAGTVAEEAAHVYKLNQELRAATSIGPFDLLLGGYFTHEHLDSATVINATDPVTGDVAAVAYNLQGTLDLFDEYAAFTDVTYHFTDQLDVQVGARYSHDKVSIGQTVETGVYAAPPPGITPGSSSTGNAFTYLLTPRYRLSPDLMTYVRLASGYRPGGPNSGASVAAGAPTQYDPDKTKEYELGLKGDFIDHQLSIDTAVYYVDWKNIQSQLFTTGAVPATYTGNAGDAKSEGVELSIIAKPWDGFTVSGWAAYDNAVITTAPANSTLYVRSGDRLPNTSKWSENVSLEQQIPIPRWSDAKAFVGGNVNFVGDRTSIFQTTAARQDFPAYTKADLHVGLSYASWRATAYVNNVGDTRGLLQGGIGYYLPHARVYTQPRTFGLAISTTF